MTDPPARVRSDARPMITFMESMGVDINQFPPGRDGWHSAASIRSALQARMRELRQTAPRPIPTAAARTARMAATAQPANARSGGEDVVAWAHRTNRIASASVATWRQRLAADPGVAEVLRSLTPVDRPASAAPAQASTRPARAAGPYATTPGIPAFTASGLDPKALASYPPSVRAAMAGVPTQAQAFDIGRRYGGLTDDQAKNAMTSDPNISADLIGSGWFDDFCEPNRIADPTPPSGDGWF